MSADPTPDQVAMARALSDELNGGAPAGPIVTITVEPTPGAGQLLADLNCAKVLFQARALRAALGLPGTDVRSERIGDLLAAARDAHPTPMSHRCATCGVKDGHELGCAENEPPEDDLSDGLWERFGRLYYTCRGCDQTRLFDGDPEEFQPDVAYCGGSPRCLP